ncbi:MAG: hypothetical protein ACKO5E_22470 [bacterium]
MPQNLLPATCLMFIWSMLSASLAVQTPNAAISTAYVGELVIRKYPVDASTNEPVQPIKPRINPPGSALFDLRIDPEDKKTLVLRVIPIKTGRIRLERWGYQLRSTEQKFLQPIEIDCKPWPVEPASRAIRAGVGDLKLSLQTQPTKATAGTPIEVTLQATGKAALAINLPPTVEIVGMAEDAPASFRPSLVESGINWLTPARIWTYQWIPQSPGSWRLKPLLISHIGSDNQIKTILATGQVVEILPRPVFTQSQPNPSQPPPEPRQIKVMVIAVLVLPAVVFFLLLLVRPLFRRLILQFRLKQAIKPDQSFENSLELYRNIFLFRDLHQIKRRPRDRELLDQLEKRLFGRG